jgi:hydrogenase maturation factor
MWDYTIVGEATSGMGIVDQDRRWRQRCCQVGDADIMSSVTVTE